jgi:hypothetical protein
MQMKVDPGSGFVYYGIKGMFDQNDTFLEFLEAGNRPAPTDTTPLGRGSTRSATEIARQWEDGRLERFHQKKGSGKPDDGTVMSPIIRIMDSFGRGTVPVWVGTSQPPANTDTPTPLPHTTAPKRRQVYLFDKDGRIVAVPVNFVIAAGPVVAFWL